MTMETIMIEKTADGRPWEGCINSVNYRIERGVQVEVPEEVARLVRRSEQEKRASAALTERFTRADGVRL